MHVHSHAQHAHAQVAELVARVGGGRGGPPRFPPLLLDVCCGGGAIGLWVAQAAAAVGTSTRVLGIEANQAAAADAASICALLHTLRGALLTRDEARLRRDDCALPPPPVQQGWLTIKLAGQGHALSRPFRAFALLGSSKLLLFSDRTCRGVLKAPSWWCHSSLA